LVVKLIHLVNLHPQAQRVNQDFIVQQEKLRACQETFVVSLVVYGQQLNQLAYEALQVIQI
jgi:hypothetical protein